MFRRDFQMGKLLKALGVGACMFLAVLALKGGFAPEEDTDLWAALSDALFVPGVLLTGSALLVIFSGMGAYTGLAYPTMKALSMLRREEKRREMPGTYYEYVEKRSQKPRRLPLELLLVGIVMLIGAGIALWIS